MPPLPLEYHGHELAGQFSRDRVPARLGPADCY